MTQLLRALEADGAADDARVAADRRRRRARSRGAEEDSRDGFLAPPSVAPPTLPLVLLAHPSSAVREGAARAFAERIAAVPQRAPAALHAVEIEDLKNLIQEDLTQEIPKEVPEEEIGQMNQTGVQESLVLVHLTEEVILKDLAQESLKIIQVLEGLSHLILIAIPDLGEAEENSIC